MQQSWNNDALMLYNIIVETKSRIIKLKDDEKEDELFLNLDK